MQISTDRLLAKYEARVIELTQRNVILEAAVEQLQDENAALRGQVDERPRDGDSDPGPSH